MDRGKAGLTVFFEGSFWVGVFERIEDGKLSVCRMVVFGSEPRDYEVWDFVLKNYYSLRFSPAVEAAVKESRINPKRRQREAVRQTMQAGIPCLTLPAEKEQPIGLFGKWYLWYLKEHHRITYTNLLTSGRLNAYLADIDRWAQERFEWLIEGMKQAQGITS